VPPTTPDPERDYTHYCDWDEPGNRLVRALCGRIIQRRHHVSKPTCPQCQEGLAYRERESQDEP
jgi:hypothetical protein